MCSMCQGPASPRGFASRCFVLSILVLNSHAILVLLQVWQPAAIQPVYRPGCLQWAAVADEGKLPVYPAALASILVFHITERHQQASQSRSRWAGMLVRA